MSTVSLPELRPGDVVAVRRVGLERGGPLSARAKEVMPNV